MYRKMLEHLFSINEIVIEKNFMCKQKRNFLWTPTTFGKLQRACNLFYSIYFPHVCECIHVHTPVARDECLRNDRAVVSYGGGAWGICPSCVARGVCVFCDVRVCAVIEVVFLSIMHVFVLPAS